MGKLVVADGPRRRRAAWSYTRAASSAVSNVPSHTRALCCDTRISAPYFPHGRFLTPRNFLSGAAAVASIVASTADSVLFIGPTRRLWLELAAAGDMATGCRATWISCTRRRARRGASSSPSSSPEESVASWSLQRTRTTLGAGAATAGA
ncbi:Os06g0160450, partial [Oryza sativa Japonica Group]